MKDLSLFLVKNSFGSKMKKGFRNLCNGEDSTSTLDQQKVDNIAAAGSSTNSPGLRESHQPTLEEMILQLEMEEKKDRKGYYYDQHRMSCVDSSDILRTARNALNQYPRFSLDGKDAMYRSSFKGRLIPNYELEAEKSRRQRRLPNVIGGESVIWCKPGVVAKLMGLEAMPVPLNSNYRWERVSAMVKRQNLRKRAEMERRRSVVMAMGGGDHRRRSGSAQVGSSCSRNGYCVMKPRLGDSY